jgi:hypothetical protein
MCNDLSFSLIKFVILIRFTQIYFRRNKDFKINNEANVEKEMKPWEYKAKYLQLKQNDE